METITIILGLVMLVFGILQIILFFKLWGMTNDVKRLTVRFDSPDINYIIKEIHKKNPNIADLLFESSYRAMNKEYGWTNEGYDSIKNKYKKLYAKAGIEFPSVFENINTKEDWESTFML